MFRGWLPFSVWNCANVIVHLIIVAFAWQLWSNVRTAFADQPDLVELAESLSENFESLYEKEVRLFLSFSYCFFASKFLLSLTGQQVPKYFCTMNYTH